jgi:diaminopimelate decarboxylase
MNLCGSQQIGPDGILIIGDCEATRLAERFGTPLYVLDESRFRDNCRRYVAASRAAYPNSDVAYASKALATTALCSLAEQEGLWLDVSSPGELATAMAAEFPTERTIYHGSNKALEEVRVAVSARVALLVVDWLGELEMVERVGRELGRSIDVLLRVAPGVDPDTHEAIRTGHADTKFGLCMVNGPAAEGVERALGSSHIELLGYHSHVGSQLLEPDANVEAIVEMGRFAREMHGKHGFWPRILDVGGGLGVRYQSGDTPPSFEEFNRAIAAAVRDSFGGAGLNLPRLVQEPGRAIVADAGITLYRVGAVKRVQLPGGSVRTYVSVDGGLSDNPRPQLYGAAYECFLANRAEEPDTLCRIAGAHCETDTLIEAAVLPDPRPGDLLAVPCTAAYCYSMSSNYNRFPRPAMVLVADGEADVIVERETVQDTLRQDRMPPRLLGSAEPARRTR